MTSVLEWFTGALLWEAMRIANETAEDDGRDLPCPEFVRDGPDPFAAALADVERDLEARGLIVDNYFSIDGLVEFQDADDGAVEYPADRFSIGWST